MMLNPDQAKQIAGIAGWVSDCNGYWGKSDRTIFQGDVQWEGFGDLLRVAKAQLKSEQMAKHVFDVIFDYLHDNDKCTADLPNAFALAILKALEDK